MLPLANQVLAVFATPCLTDYTDPRAPAALGAFVGPLALRGPRDADVPSREEEGRCCSATELQIFHLCSREHSACQCHQCSLGTAQLEAAIEKIQTQMRQLCTTPISAACGASDQASWTVVSRPPARAQYVEPGDGSTTTAARRTNCRPATGDAANQPIFTRTPPKTAPTGPLRPSG